MSTREMLISMIDEMSEEEMLVVISQIKENPPKKKKKAADVCGILSKYANPDIVPMEKKAWETYVEEKYGKNGQ